MDSTCCSSVMFEPKVGEDCFKDRRNKSLCFFWIVTDKNGAALYMCSSSYSFVFGSEAVKSRLINRLVLKQIAIHFHLLFYHPWIFTPGRADLRGKNRLHNHIYLKCKREELLDDLLLSCGTGRYIIPEFEEDDEAECRTKYEPKRKLKRSNYSNYCPFWWRLHWYLCLEPNVMNYLFQNYCFSSCSYDQKHWYSLLTTVYHIHLL